jgi:hypothetical protein
VADERGRIVEGRRYRHDLPSPPAPIAAFWIPVPDSERTNALRALTRAREDLVPTRVG